MKRGENWRKSDIKIAEYKIRNREKGGVKYKCNHIVHRQIEKQKKKCVGKKNGDKHKEMLQGTKENEETKRENDVSIQS